MSDETLGCWWCDADFHTMQQLYVHANWDHPDEFAEAAQRPKKREQAASAAQEATDG